MPVGRNIWNGRLTGSRADASSQQVVSTKGFDPGRADAAQTHNRMGREMSDVLIKVSHRLSGAARRATDETSTHLSDLELDRAAKWAVIYLALSEKEKRHGRQ